MRKQLMTEFTVVMSGTLTAVHLVIVISPDDVERRNEFGQQVRGHAEGGFLRLIPRQIRTMVCRMENVPE